VEIDKRVVTLALLVVQTLSLAAVETLLVLVELAPLLRLTPV
jgi:hypothetical protein